MAVAMWQAEQIALVRKEREKENGRNHVPEQARRGSYP
jgi:hypothetical protein